ncbi:unnamed protein product [Amaranthus hypochondriacus]
MFILFPRSISLLYFHHLLDFYNLLIYAYKSGEIQIDIGCRRMTYLQYCSLQFHRREAYDALDPNGNITIKWDVINWTPDGYVPIGF